MAVSPYLFFDGACEEAIDFYKQAVGAEVLMLMRYRDAPPPSGPDCEGPSKLPPGSGDKIMHAALKIAGSEIMASDGFCQGLRKFDGFSLSFQAPDKTSAAQAFGALAEGGEIRQQLTETFFSPAFGMVADKFGVGWIVVVPQA